MKRIRVSRWFLGIMALSVLIVIIYGFKYTSDTSVLLNGRADRYYSGWMYTDSDGDKHAVQSANTYVNTDTGLLLTVTNILPDNLADTDCMCIRTYNQCVSVFVEDNEIYSFGDRSERFMASSPGIAWNVIPLKADYSGKTIRIEYNARYSVNSGTFGEVYIGESSAVIGTVIGTRLPAIILCVVILIFAAALFIYGFMLSRLKEDYRGVMYLGIHATLLALWSYGQTGAMQLLYTNTAVMSLAASLCLIVSIIPFILHIFRSFFNEETRLCRIICLVLFGLYAANIVASMSGMINIEVCVAGIVFVHMLTCAYLAVKGFINIFKKKEIRYIFLSAAVIELLVFEVMDFLNYIKGIPADYSQSYRIGFLIYLAAVTVYSYKKYSVYSAEYLEKYALEKMAYEDYLTKCKNRLYFNNELTETDKTMGQYKSVAVAVFDMNNLKFNNDMYGHGAGDMLLKQCAQAITRAFGEKGSCARIGGDEFAVILKNTAPEEISGCIINMLDEVESCNYTTPYFLEIAYGYAIFDPRYDGNLEDVLIRADKKMYECKRLMKEKPIIKNG